MTPRVGSLVQWRYVDGVFIGVILRDLGTKIKTKKYLTYWFKSGNIKECFETDLRLISF